MKSRGGAQGASPCRAFDQDCEGRPQSSFGSERWVNIEFLVN